MRQYLRKINVLKIGNFLVAKKRVFLLFLKRKIQKMLELNFKEIFNKKNIFNFFKKQKKRIIIFVFSLILIISGSFYFQSKKVSAAWWNDSWLYRKAIPVTNSSGSVLTDFQVKILDNKDLSADITAGKIQASLNDLRFTDINGDLLSYWIEDSTANSVDVWIKMTSVPTSGATVYFYYGNPTASAFSDGNKVFEFFDTFDAFDANKWKATGAYSIAGSELTITTGALYTNSTILASAQNYVYEYRAKWNAVSGTYAGLSIADVQGTTGSNVGSNKVVYYMTNNGSLDMFAYAANGLSASYNIALGPLQYIATAATYYTSSFSVDPTNIRFYNNRIQTNAYAGTWSSAPYLFLGMFTGKNSTATDNIRDITVDWVLARKYASANPTIGTFASEEKSTGPIAYWKFDDGFGIIAQDSTSNNNDATLTNGPTWTEGRSGGAVKFDGVNDYVSLPSGFSDFTSGFTYSVWAKPTSSASYSRFLDIGNGQANNNILIDREATSSTLNFLVCNGSTCTNVVSAASAIINNEWHYYTVTENATGNVVIYRDGVRIASGNALVPANVLRTSNYIGKSNWTGDSYFAGMMDDAKIYNYARTAAQIKTDYNAGLAGASANEGTAVSMGNGAGKITGAAPVAYWNMDENTGTAVRDTSGNGFNSTSFSTPTWTRGKFGSALKFNGSSDKVKLPNPLIGSTSFSVSAWVYPTVNDGYFISAGSGGLALTLTNGGQLFCGPNGQWIVGPTLAINNWYYVSAVFDGTTTYLYVNGVKYAQGAQSFSHVYGTDLGAYNGTAGYFSGKLDEVKIYNYARTQSQLLEDMQGGNPAEKTPTSYYKFDEGNGTIANNTGFAGSAVNGTLVAGGGGTNPTVDSMWDNSGKFGKAIELDGSGDYVSIPDSDGVNDFNYNQDFSVSTWVKIPATQLNTTASNNMILEKWSGVGAYSYVLRVLNQTTAVVADRGKIYFARYDGTVAPSLTSKTALNDNNWHHLIFSKVGGNLYLFVDGKQDATTADTTTTTTTNASGLFIGQRGSGGYYFNGSVDELKIFNYGLTSDDAKLEYDQGKSVTMASAGISAGAGDNSAKAEYCVPGDVSTCNAPVGEWKFDEKNGTTANDTSGNGIAGTLTGSPAWTIGKYGSALQFNGTANYVNFGNNFNFTTQSFSFGYWMRLNSFSTGTAGQGPISIFKGSFSGNGYYSQITQDGSITFSTNQAGAAQTSSTPIGTIAINNWYHIEYVRAGSSVKIYVNGLDKTSVIANHIDPASSNNNFVVGHYGTAGSIGFNGKIDQVLVYNYARTPAQVAYDYNRGGPIGWWKMDECQGAALFDASGSGNNGTINIGVTGTQTALGTCTLANSAWGNGAIGKFGSSLNFDGTDDYVSLNSFSNITSVADYSYGFWFYLNSFTHARMYAFDFRGNGSMTSANAPLLLIDQSGSDCILDAYTGVELRSDSVPCVAQWHYAAVARSGLTTNIYLDGILKVSGNAGTGSDLSAGKRFGTYSAATSGGNYWWNGKLDDFKFYNYALTKEQIANIMNENSALRFGPITGGQ